MYAGRYNFCFIEGFRVSVAPSAFKVKPHSKALNPIMQKNQDLHRNPES